MPRSTDGTKKPLTSTRYPPISTYDGTNPEDPWGKKKWLIARGPDTDPERTKPLNKAGKYDPTTYTKYECVVCGEPGWRLIRSHNGGARTIEKHPGCKLQYNPVYNLDPADGPLKSVDPAKSRAARSGAPVCGAKRKDGKPCQNPRGFKTDHPGVGLCYRHLGNAPSGKKAADKEYAARLVDIPLLGNKIDVDPHTAILDEVRRSYGHVEWLGMVIRLLGANPDDPQAAEKLAGSDMRAKGLSRTLVQMTSMGVQPSVWINMYHEERKHLVSVCKAAVSMGVAERAITLAEEQGRMLAAVIRAVLDDPELGLSPAQMVAAPQVVRRHLLSIPRTTSTEASGATGRPRKTTEVLAELKSEDEALEGWDDV